VGIDYEHDIIYVEEPKERLTAMEHERISKLGWFFDDEDGNGWCHFN